jgi:hypothetical protein
VIGAVLARQQLLHRGHEILGNGAADAAIGQFDHVLSTAGLVAAGGEHLPVDAEIAELVDDQRQPLATRMLQRVTDECRLAGPQKAGDDGNGNPG